MAFQVGSTCYDTALSANQAAGAASIGQVVNVGASAFVVDIATVDSTSITFQLRDIASTAVIVKVAQVSPVPCQLLDTVDAIAISWGVALSWILAASIMFIRRGMHQ